MKYFKRHLEAKLKKRLKNSQITTLTGMRQSGKSTLLQNLFQDWKYITFDNIVYRQEAASDPRLFLKRYQNEAIFDEVQKVPDLFHEIKLQVDSDKGKKFILSGSSNFLLMSKISESLAGRTALCELFPFTLSELKEKRLDKFFLQDLQNTDNIKDLKILSKNKYNFNEIIDSVFYGGFPKVYEFKSHEDKLSWLQDYQTTVIEKDFRDFIKVKNLQEFSKLYRMLAFQTGNILNYTNLSNDLGVSNVTVKEYTHLLITSYQFFLLYPFYKKQRKRLVKTPKLYSVDTGLSNFLERIITKDQLLNSGRLGNIFENWVICELLKQRSFLDFPPEFYFFRTSSGIEVDLIIDFVNKVIPIEIKSSAKVDKSAARNINAFIELHKKLNIPFGVVLYLGEEELYLDENIIALPVGAVL